MTDLVLVPVHTRQSTNMREDILQRVGELEGVDVAQTVLHVSVDDELGEAQDFAAQMEGGSEAGFLAFFGRESPERVMVRFNTRACGHH